MGRAWGAGEGVRKAGQQRTEFDPGSALGGPAEGSPPPTIPAAAVAVACIIIAARLIVAIERLGAGSPRIKGEAGGTSGGRGGVGWEEQRDVLRLRARQGCVSRGVTTTGSDATCSSRPHSPDTCAGLFPPLPLLAVTCNAPAP